MGKRKGGSPHDLTKIERFVLNALIRLRDNAYGVSIHREIAAMGEVVSAAAIYFALERMEDAGFVRTEMGQPGPKGKAKRFFYIKGEGQIALEASEAAAREKLARISSGLPQGGVA